MYTNTSNKVHFYVDVSLYMVWRVDPPDPLLKVCDVSKLKDLMLDYSRKKD